MVTVMETRKQTIKTSDPEDPVVHLLKAMHQAAYKQANKAVDAFLTKIKETLKKHIPVIAQGPLLANALSTAMQFKMSIWNMISDECIGCMCTKHSDWCGLAGIIQAIVKTEGLFCCVYVTPSTSRFVTVLGILYSLTVNERLE